VADMDEVLTVALLKSPFYKGKKTKTPPGRLTTPASRPVV
jgi:hypothetical protein